MSFLPPFLPLFLPPFLALFLALSAHLAFHASAVKHPAAAGERRRDCMFGVLLFAKSKIARTAPSAATIRSKNRNHS